MNFTSGIFSSKTFVSIYMAKIVNATFAYQNTGGLNNLQMWHLPSLPYIYSSVFLYLRHFFVPCMRRHSNLGRPKLSLDRLLGQTSNLERVEPII